MNIALDKAPGGCGCDDQPGHALLPLADAISRGLDLAHRVAEVEMVPLTQAMGRVLAEDAIAPIPLPPFDNSAMDGYLVRLADLDAAGGRDGPWRLRLRGRIAAGDGGSVRPEAGTALRILTGAIVPDGFDAVVMQEDCEVADGYIRFSRRPAPGQHVRPAGGDASKGQVVVHAGAEIGPRQAGALAAIGMAMVPVLRKVRVAIFSTGSELKSPGEPLEAGQIWNSNRFMLLALMKQDWVDMVDMGAIADNPAALGKALREACESCDLVVTTGGVSVGDEDHMPRLFEEAGGEMSVMKVAIKPGKPITFGRLNRAIFVGLPGNPVSAFVTWLIIGARMARKTAGLADTAPVQIPVQSASDISRKPGRQEFRPARLSMGKTGPEVTLLDASFSGRIALLSEADGLAVIAADTSRVAKGDRLDFIPF